MITNRFTSDIYFLAMAVGCMTAIACNQTNQKENKGRKKMKGIETAMMDSSANPCDDFYRYANGNWLDHTEIPSTESRWGSFNELRDRNYDLLKTVLEDAASDVQATSESERGKVGIFYRTAMDTAKRNKLGIEPLREEFETLKSIDNKEALLRVIAHHHLMNISSLFDITVDQDMKHSDTYLFEIDQGGMGIPIPEIYTDAAKGGKLKELYKKHIGNMFMLAGEESDKAAADAATVLDFETQLAENAMTALERRDLDAQYNKWTLDELKAKAPHIDWDAYLDMLHVHPEEVLVAQPDFLKKADELFENMDISSWKTYLAWQLLNKMANKLSDDFVLEHFSFYGTAMSGTREMKPLWKLSLESANRNIGQLLGKEFVRKAFTPESRERLNKLIDNLILVFRERIRNLAWMSDESKVTAYAKLDSLGRKLAYPDKWIDFSSLKLSEDSYVENCIACQKFWVRYKLDKLGTPVDKTEWQIAPQIVNAFYNPTTNSICFPAGILQPPFMDPEADDAVLYATIGAVIGHELTHGFDDMGKQFDASGNKRNWWTEEDSMRFKERSQKLVDQFNQFEVIDSVFINGELTLGENIADLGGLIMAYHAFRKSMEGKEDYTIDGFNTGQLFFIAYAQLWRGKATDSEAKRLAMMDPHAPPRFRVQGALSNMPEFYEVFGCKEQSAYYLPDEQRTSIW